MGLHDLDKYEIKEMNSKNPDIEYLQIIGLSSEEIKEKTNINVLDIIEKKAIIINKEHFINNILQMIDNGNINYELGIGEHGEDEEKYNKKVRNFIAKTNGELIRLGISLENIIKIRIKTGKREFISSLLELIRINPYEIENNLVLNYLLEISDFNKGQLGLDMPDLDLLGGAFKRAKKEINNK